MAFLLQFFPLSVSLSTLHCQCWLLTRDPWCLWSWASAFHQTARSLARQNYSLNNLPSSFTTFYIELLLHTWSHGRRLRRRCCFKKRKVKQTCMIKNKIKRNNFLRRAQERNDEISKDWSIQHENKNTTRVFILFYFISFLLTFFFFLVEENSILFYFFSMTFVRVNEWNEWEGKGVKWMSERLDFNCIHFKLRRKNSHHEFDLKGSIKQIYPACPYLLNYLFEFFFVCLYDL